jgi:hypothetical protein
MDRLGRQVEHELERITPAGADMVAIVRAWPAAVGEENARRAWPARLARDGTLHVNAADSVWAFQLGMLAEPILERLRDHLGEATPPSLRFAAGPIPEPAAEPPEPDERSLVSVAPEDAAEGALLAAEIEDVELRELVARAAAASLARARSGRRF